MAADTCLQSRRVVENFKIVHAAGHALASMSALEAKRL